VSTELSITPEKTGALSKIASLGSIERVVAFVVGPIVVAGSATLSGWLSTKIGVQVSSATITGAVATGGLTAGALAYKWLDGRSYTLVTKAEALVKAGYAHLAPFADDLKLVPGANGALQIALKTVESEPMRLAATVGGPIGPGLEETAQRLEQTIKDELSKAVAVITKPNGAVNAGEEKTSIVGSTTTWNAGAPVAAAPPPVAPIPPATNDPAPATPVQAQPAVAQAADAGAAPTQ
jgi:hypothetical protein